METNRRAFVMGAPGRGRTPDMVYCTTTTIAGQREPHVLWSTSQEAAEGATYRSLTHNLGLRDDEIRWGCQPVHPLARPLFRE